MGPQDRRDDRGRRVFHEGLTAALLHFAERHFALSKPDEKTGKTRLQILNEIRVQTGVVAPELKDLPSLPLGTEHIWRWFCDLDRRRTAGWSMNPTTWSDIHAYFNMLRVRPQAWELAALIRLDDSFITSRIKSVAGSARGAKALKQRMTGKAAK